jgi:hypothetical protein
MHRLQNYKKKIRTAEINFPLPRIYNKSGTRRMTFSIVSTFVEIAINLSSSDSAVTPA